jgi:protoheme IX farnesyltransferase
MSAAATHAAPAPAAVGTVWQDVAVLLKLRIDALIVCVALAAAVAAGTTDPRTLGVLAFGCLAASAGASALNHVLDRRFDARMARTRARPIPSGRIRPGPALVVGVGLIALSQTVAPVLGVATALYLLAGALTYALVYTWWLKPRTPWSIVLGGAAGSFAALAGWATGATTLAAAPLLLALVLFLWTPSHFWSLSIVLERDYREAGLPMLSARAGARKTARAVAVSTAVLVAASLALAPFLAWPYTALAIPAGAAFLALTIVLARRPGTGLAWRTFKLSGLYLLVLLAGLVLAGAP